jgi:membrane fusion protein (multidrug efflux system)
MTTATAPTATPWIRIGALSLALACTALAGCKGKDAAKDDKAADGAQASEQQKLDKDGKPIQKPDAVPVEVSQVAKRPISASYTGTAPLEAPNESQVVAKASGVIVQMLAEEGDVVHKGQVLARVDPERARLEAQRALTTVRKLENNYRRSKELAERKLVSADANDQIRYELESARASYELAALELSYTNITAPISGVVAQRMVKAGNLVGLNAPVFRIVDNSHLEAVLNVPERELATLKAGQRVSMAVDALPGKPFTGVIDRVSPVVDSGSGTFRVVCAFDGAGDTLRPGMFGRIQIVYDSRQDALTIPRTALLEDEGETAVYTVRDKKAVRVPVTLGYVNGELAEIRAGLREGEPVITAGKVAVRDGTEVQVLNGAAAKPAAEVVAAAATQPGSK